MSTEKTKKSKKERKIKKDKKNITLGIVHIQATFNNTIVAFTDVQGNLISIASAGRFGFKGPKKSSPYAAQVTVENAAKVAKEHGFKTVSIRIKGAGGQREPAIRAVGSQDLIITQISDVSPLPHNGCKPPKRRRI